MARHSGGVPEVVMAVIEAVGAGGRGQLQGGAGVAAQPGGVQHIQPIVAARAGRGGQGVVPPAAVQDTVGGRGVAGEGTAGNNKEK